MPINDNVYEYDEIKVTEILMFVTLKSKLLIKSSLSHSYYVDLK